MDFLRLGQVHKILPEIQSYSAQRAAAGIKTVNELKQFYESKVTNMFCSQRLAFDPLGQLMTFAHNSIPYRFHTTYLQYRGSRSDKNITSCKLHTVYKRA